MKAPFRQDVYLNSVENRGRWVDAEIGSYTLVVVFLWINIMVHSFNMPIDAANKYYKNITDLTYGYKT